jgi:PhzF family phenazine biosynthesis protein
MRLPIYQLDAFTARRFAGNPAAVIPLQNFLPNAMLQAIAAENDLSETAYLVKEGAGYNLRWFTPVCEVPLCGHGTLASAAVVLDRLEPARDEVQFHTASGVLTVKRSADGLVMDLPASQVERVELVAGVAEALGAQPLEVWVNDRFTLVLLADAARVRALTPKMEAVAGLDPHGVIVTAPGDAGLDFVSRFFAPAMGVDEDPVTGSAHCVLAPFWAGRLGRTVLRAHQASRRGGDLTCRLVADRVELVGQCVFYMEGTVEV